MSFEFSNSIRRERDNEALMVTVLMAVSTVRRSPYEVANFQTARYKSQVTLGITLSEGAEANQRIEGI